jgi:RimJ/RimL family protein N-acetyltransferase
MIVIQTPRLILRKFTKDDVDNLLGIFSDPETMTYFPSTRNRAETEEWIDRNLKSYEENGFGLYALELEATGQFIGYCGFILQKDVDGLDEIEIGYGLRKDFWRQGYAAEAAEACKEYGFANLGAGRIISLIHPENAPSRRVAERNGMKVEKSILRWGFEHLVYVAERQGYRH